MKRLAAVLLILVGCSQSPVEAPEAPVVAPVATPTQSPTAAPTSIPRAPVDYVDATMTLTGQLEFYTDAIIDAALAEDFALLMTVCVNAYDNISEDLDDLPDPPAMLEKSDKAFTRAMQYYLMAFQACSEGDLDSSSQMMELGTSYMNEATDALLEMNDE